MRFKEGDDGTLSIECAEKDVEELKLVPRVPSQELWVCEGTPEAKLVLQQHFCCEAAACKVASGTSCQSSLTATSEETEDGAVGHGNSAP